MLVVLCHCKPGPNRHSSVGLDIFNVFKHFQSVKVALNRISFHYYRNYVTLSPWRKCRVLDFCAMVLFNE